MSMVRCLDPETISLAVKVVDVLVPYVTIGAKEFVRTAGKDAYEKAKGLFETLKMRWSEDKEASEALEKFEKKPGRYQPVIEDVLKEKLDNETGLADELQKILNNMGPEIEIIQKMAVAEGIVGLETDEMVSGKVKVEQEFNEGKDVIGARIKRIG